MKFLYVANERQAAELAGFALRSVAPDVAVSWAAGLGQAKRWVDENRNVSALIIEVESDTRSFEALVGHARQRWRQSAGDRDPTDRHERRDDVGGHGCR